MLIITSESIKLLYTVQLEISYIDTLIYARVHVRAEAEKNWKMMLLCKTCDFTNLAFRTMKIQSNPVQFAKTTAS